MGHHPPEANPDRPLLLGRTEIETQGIQGTRETREIQEIIGITGITEIREMRGILETLLRHHGPRARPRLLLGSNMERRALMPHLHHQQQHHGSSMERPLTHGAQLLDQMPPYPLRLHPQAILPQDIPITHMQATMLHMVVPHLHLPLLLLLAG